MAASKTPKSKLKDSSVPKVQWQGYVSWNMSIVDKKIYEEWKAAHDIEGNVLPTVITSGYKVSLSYDSKNDAAVAALYCQDVRSPNAGWCLTARAGDCMEALYRALYVHFVCFETVWSIEAGYNDEVWT